MIVGFGTGEAGWAMTSSTRRSLSAPGPPVSVLVLGRCMRRALVIDRGRYTAMSVRMRCTASWGLMA